MTYRILSMDGGGTWALIEVQALINLYGERATGHQVLSKFDLVAANSGGSLVLGGLIEDLTLSDLLGYFQDETKRRAIFSPTLRWWNRAVQWLSGIGPKYNAEAKLSALEQLMPRFGTTTLPNVARGIQGHAGNDVHLLIIGFDYHRNRATYFRSAPAPAPALAPTGPGAGLGTGGPSAAALAEAIHASSNAPVNYFDAPAAFPGRIERYWDGAIAGCNNPVLAAVTEAVALGQEPRDIVALSLGTGSVVLPSAARGAPPSPYELPYVDSSMVTDLKKLATSIVDDPPDAATFIAHVMTGSGIGSPAAVVSRIVRMNPLVSPVRDPAGNWTAPGGMTLDEFMYMRNLDFDALRPEQMAAIARYCALWLADNAPNQPIRMDGATLSTEIGYDRFSAARAAWQALFP